MAVDAKELVRARLPLADIVGEVVALKPAGSGRLKGLCPFHSEKTPSFHVHTERGFFYCFGCQARGDIFDFVMRTRGMDFVEALQHLGARAGVDVESQPGAGRKRRDLFDVNALALAFFRSNLPGFALAYLNGRGIREQSIEAFELGFAPDGWDGLLVHARQQGVADEQLLAAGLLVENERGRRYDRFRGRIMFPVKDSLGRVVGFSGRVLDDGQPKYVNTPETELFRKGELLYGLDLARSSIRATGECVVVEGIIDVIALWQAGIDNVVAVLGATLTQEQAQLLARLDVERLFLAFDADEAGQRATLAGLEHTIGRSFLVKAVRVPHGKDPADAVLEGHVEDFKKALEHGLSEVQFRFQAACEKSDPRTLEGKRRVLNELLSALKPRDVFDPVAFEMRRLVVDELGIDEARLDTWLAAKRTRELGATQLKAMTKAGSSSTAVIELEIIALLLLEPDSLRGRLEWILASLPPREDSLLAEFAAHCQECAFDDRRLLERYRERPDGRILFERLLSHEGHEELRIDIDVHIAKALSRLRERYLDGAKDGHRAKLVERLKAVQERLGEDELPQTQLDEYHRELRQIQAVLAARDAERRLRVPASFHRVRRR